MQNLTRIVVFSFCFSLVLEQTSFCQKFRSPFRKKSSAVAATKLQESDGPWLIMCSSYTGEDAERNARLLANELSKHRFKTYLYRQTFDYSGKITGFGWRQPESVQQLAGEELSLSQQLDVEPEPKTWKSANHTKTNEVAVLVGDFSSPDDSRAQKALKKIKGLDIALHDKSDQLKKNNREEDKPKRTIDRTPGGPLRTAFLLPNPMLPDEYFQKNQLDNFVIKNNKQLENSLFSCPGKFSIKIATFRGESTIDPGRISKNLRELDFLKRNGKSVTKSRLLEAEENAHKITEMLRKRGVEAYEFHDRHQSIVCIGSFDWVTRETNGTVMNNPDIVSIVNKLSPQVKSLPGAPNAIVPKSLMGIPLDPEPMPILVPKLENHSRVSSRLSFRR